MKNLKSQLNKKRQYHLNCIIELLVNSDGNENIDGLSHSDHIQAVKTLSEVLTQIKINDHYDSVMGFKYWE